MRRPIVKAGVRLFVMAAMVAFLGVKLGQCATPEVTRRDLLKTCENEKYEFTLKVRQAFLAYAKSQAQADLKADGKSLPKEFLTWIDANPDVEAAVYVAHDKPSAVLLQLYSLRLDLGKTKFEKYHQLALAAAIVHAKRMTEVDITPREPLKIAVNGDPRKPIDTKEPGRKLDINDHIINFLNDNTIVEEVAADPKDAGKLKYDSRGIAIPAAKGKSLPPLVKRKRSLYAADVLASKELQAKFNAYMKSKGHAVSINCGDRIVHWQSRDAVHGQQNKDITTAYKLFRTAYEAKGLLPRQADETPSVAERCIYMIRNYEYTFPAELQAERKWPQFPITAPWPVLTLLVDDDQPLREREERWIAFRDRGEFKKYGEYIGAIAQQFDIQSARRLKPHPFTYNTVQMMLKDGGVCGTMGAISARSHNSLGIPACQAIQPGHCAMISFQYDTKKKLYVCKGGQYATGGDEITIPFSRWFFGDAAKNYPRSPGFGVQPNPRKHMVYHQSVAWAVNHGMSTFHDSTMAYAVYQLLDESSRQAHGKTLLKSGFEINPYNFLLTDAAQAAADTPQAQVQFWQVFTTALESAGDKYGCRPLGLYSQTVKTKVFASISKMPVPEDKEAAAIVFAFLKFENCDAPAALVNYRFALEGLSSLLTQTNASFKDHLVSSRVNVSEVNDKACKAMAAELKAVGACIQDKEQKTKWALGLLALSKGREKYFGRWARVATDPAIAYLAQQAGQRMPDNTQLTQALLDRLAGELKDSVAGPRDLKSCRLLATKIGAAAKFLREPAQKKKWASDLSKIIAGHETFIPKTTNKNARPVRDPCADAIKGLL